MAYTAHVDTFARDNLPPQEQWPEFLFELPELHYPARMNCAAELLDAAVERGWGDRTAIMRPTGAAPTPSCGAGQPHRPRAGRGHGPRARQPGAAARRRTTR